MPSGRNFIASIGVIATCIAIISYIDSQDMEIDDISLVKACRQSNIREADCIAFEDAGITWDYKQPCQQFFKAEQYYYTPRMIFEASRSGNTTYGDALESVYKQACGSISQDADWEAYKSGAVQGRSEKRELILWFILVALLLAGAYTASNYKACSTKLGLTAFPGGTFTNINDSAQCASNYYKDPSKCKRFHAAGTGGWWYSRHRHYRNYLNNGCVTHDNCLQSNKCAGSARNACDGSLATAAKSCLKTWRCRDSWYFSKVVKGIMSNCPNCGLAYSPSWANNDLCDRRNVRVLVDGVWQ